ncbi:conserved hypothetical protein TIGR00299 [Synechococcus sp. PCC 7335]|uniref:nickel pincer cofactor biosynthesis protein LarC n=1 Tax=Synechococcus sp. (strain ATCC 29403 / PCC 7335) TaxID=91464 RepID=UPI00017EB0F1|nr:nickel pincer cofactor biosynthesis protein LarC [Synechococcus sp. PCC 7335]EDX87617.1 conserved hypothetical protein TIGR00299 [Synechococcus sp. PCC 7335]
MKTLAYFDCPTGIAGDMCLGALVDAGVPIDYLKEQFAKLGIDDEFKLQAESVLRSQQAATKVHVELTEHSLEKHHHHHHHHHGTRKLPEIEKLIQQADLPQRATQWSLSVFGKLAAAEASVHSIAPEQVHFHEVGATDAIIDIVGTCLGLDWLNIDHLVCSPLPTGGGTVRCEHGLLPVPVPAVLNMLEAAEVPVYSNGIEKELVTPTGCAIAITLSESFGPPPSFRLQKVGLGAGGRELSIPNILRLWIGTIADTASDQPPVSSSYIHPTETHGLETIVELRTQIDDCSPQVIGFVFERLFLAGAVDVFTQGIAMKKNRLGTLLTVICPESRVIDCETILFNETTTLGIRRTWQKRTALSREMVSVSTIYGEIMVKLGRINGKVVNVQPEYEDVAERARSLNLAWKVVHQAAMTAAVAYCEAAHQSDLAVD